MSSRKPHILLFPSSYPSSHSPVKGVFYREQAEALRQVGLEVGVVYPDNRSLRDLSPSALLDNHWQVTGQEEEDIPTVRLHGWNIPFDWLRGKVLNRQYQNLFDRYVDVFGSPDLVHSHGVFWGGRAAQVISTREGIPFVHTEHSSGYATNVYGENDLYVIEDVLEASEQVIAVSQALAGEIRSVVSGADIDVIPNMVDTNRFTLPPELRSADPFTFIAVARLKRKKGIHVLVEAFCKEFSSEENVRLEIAGNGPEEANLRRRVSGGEMEKNICFRGLLSRSEIRNLMWKGNALVSPSFVETFGIVIIEAASTGLPIIATRSGGPEEIVTEDVGCLVDTGDISGLAQAMRQVVEVGRKSREEEAWVRERIVNRYGREAVVDQLQEVYRSAIGKADSVR